MRNEKGGKSAFFYVLHFSFFVSVALLAQSPTDPFYPEQWHLKNTGQGGGTVGEDANIESVWSTFRGSSNEIIAIVDDGLEIAHEDLAPNVVSGLSFNYLTSTTDPTPSNGANGHGTSAAGVAAARGFNGIGVTGAAPSAGLAGFNFLRAPTSANEADALSRSSNTVDVYSNSWGPTDGGASLDTLPSLTEAALVSRVATGRDGRGSIFVWAGGNGGTNDNSNYDGYANSRYALAVAASTNTGARASYSEEGANILVNAPSSGGSRGIMTTDLTGNDGYNPGTAGAGGSADPLGSTGYTAQFGGTSSAAPLVSGVVALMLQANPTLGWRDVRAILATTAEKNNTGDSDWTTNGAGYHVNHKFGFGRVDAQAAVNAARTWTNLAAEESATGSASPNVAIPDATGNTLGTAVSSSMTLSSSLKVEFVEIFFSSTDHTYWADLQLELTSPAGTTSVLARPHNAGSTSPLATRYDNWRFGSVRHFGESSMGAWRLTVRDGGPIDVGTFQNWTIKVFGTRITASPLSTLTTSVNGPGTVTSNPTGISCGTDCTERYDTGATVTLVAAPSTGAAFAGWSGDADCLDGRVTMTQDLTCSATFQTLTPAASTRLVDLSGDGSGDVFLYSATSGGWRMAFSNRLGAFNFVRSAWDAQWTITPLHLNSDVLIDFLLYNATSGVWVQARSTGAGDFTYTSGIFSAGWRVYAARLNADGIDDVFLYNSATGLAFQCFVDGAGGFSAFFPEQWAPQWEVFPALLNADTLTDIFLYNRTTGQWFRCLTTGAGGFTYTTETWSAGWSITIADFTGDGLDDVFLYSEVSGQWFQCLNTGTTFTYRTETWSPGWRIARGRIDADTRDDLFIYNPVTGRWFQCFADGAGGFSRYVTDVWSPDWQVALTDLNADGLTDVFLYNSTTGQYFQCLTAAAGNFASYFTGTTDTGLTIVAQR